MSLPLYARTGSTEITGPGIPCSIANGSPELAVNTIRLLEGIRACSGTAEVQENWPCSSAATWPKSTCL